MGRTAMKAEELVALYPRLYHMAEADAWEGIQRHGLLSTTALLDLFEVEGAARREVESYHRPASVTLRHPVHGMAVVRDQKPMDDNGLTRALIDGTTPQEWYELLNRHVFFWLRKERLERLLTARAYRDRTHAVLTLRTEGLVSRHAERIRLSPINSGATKPMPAPRGRATFSAIEEYAFDVWRAKRGQRDAVVELAVEYSVPDAKDLVVEVRLMTGGKRVG
jgi:hypothetical protein